MFSKELENLIQATLEDGVLEDYEKAALVKRAQAEGVDLAELEIYINSIIQRRKRELEEQKNAEYDALEKQKKQEFGRVCPSCGRQVPSLALKCECGYEFKNDKQESSVKILSEKIQKIQNDRNLYGEKKDEQIISIIDMFPVPNTREDIMEFLALSVPQSKMKKGIWTRKVAQKLLLYATITVWIFLTVVLYASFKEDAQSHERTSSFWSTIGASLFMSSGVAGWMFYIGYKKIKESKRIKENDRYNKRADAWRRKYEQVMMKGRSLRADVEFSQMLDYYEQQMNVEEQGNFWDKLY